MQGRTSFRLAIACLSGLLIAGAGPAPAHAQTIGLPIDAASVDGFSASANAAPGQLLALGQDGRFPGSAISQGPGSGLDADTLDGMQLDDLLELIETSSDLACSGCVGSSDLGAGAVTDSKLADGAVGSSKIAPGAIGTAQLAPNAVTGAKIADGTVAEADLAFDPATQTELDDEIATRQAAVSGLQSGLGAEISARESADTSLQSGLSAETSARQGADTGLQNSISSLTTNLATAGTVNDDTNPVQWTKLKGVPPSFGDGTDNVDGGQAVDLVCNGCVGVQDLATGAVTSEKVLDGTLDTADLANGAVTASKLANGIVSEAHLAFDPALQSELNDEATIRSQADVLIQGYIDDEEAARIASDSALASFDSALASAGTINDAANPVAWTKLKGVPAALADGTDDGLTGYEVVVGTPQLVAAGGQGTDAIACPSGKLPVSGGLIAADRNAVAVVSAPAAGAWTVVVENFSSTLSQQFTAFAVCVNGS